jgi:hypothetical protein
MASFVIGNVVGHHCAIFGYVAMRVDDTWGLHKEESLSVASAGGLGHLAFLALGSPSGPFSLHFHSVNMAQNHPSKSEFNSSCMG